MIAALMADPSSTTVLALTVLALVCALLVMLAGAVSDEVAATAPRMTVAEAFGRSRGRHVQSARKARA